VKADTRVLYGRRQLFGAYVILVATSAAGALRAPWWAALAGACSLALLSLITHKKTSSPNVSIYVDEPPLIASSIINAAMFASLAYVFGHIARWFWGL
jgi:hypothetical protein